MILAETETLWFMSLDIAEIIIPTVIPTLASIIVFGIGWWLDRRSYNKKNKERLQRDRNELFLWTKIVIQDLTITVDQLNKFAEDCLNNDHLQLPRLDIIPMIGQAFENVINQKSIEAFTDGIRSDKDNSNRQKYIANLIKQARYLNIIESEIHNSYNETRQIYISIVNTWNETYKELRNKIFNLSQTLDTSDFELLLEIKNVVDAFKSGYNKQPRNFKDLYNCIITNMNSIINKYGFNFGGYSFFDEYSDLNVTYRSWIKYNQSSNYNFSKYANDLSIIKDSLINIIKELSDKNS